MKINFKQFNFFIEQNINSLPLILLYGPNQSEIQEKCKEATELLCGPSGQTEMRVDKLTENVLLKQPDSLHTKIRTIGFFPGKRAIIIEGVTEKSLKLIAKELDNWNSDDATIILLANQLKSNSALRKLIENHPIAICLAVYDDQINLKKIETLIDSFSVKIVDKEILAFVKEPGSFSSLPAFIGFMRKLEAFKYSDKSPVTMADIELILIDENNTREFEMIDYLAKGDIAPMVLLLKNLFNSGMQPNQIINSTHRHFKLLYKLSLNPNNPDLVLKKIYPPIFGSRRHQILLQSRSWSTKLLERALEIIYKVEKDIRSSPKLGINFYLERSFLRIGHLIKPIN